MSCSLEAASLRQLGNSNEKPCNLADFVAVADAGVICSQDRVTVTVSGLISSQHCKDISPKAITIIENNILESEASRGECTAVNLLSMLTSSSLCSLTQDMSWSDTCCIHTLANSGLRWIYPKRKENKVCKVQVSRFANLYSCMQTNFGKCSEVQSLSEGQASREKFNSKIEQIPKQKAISIFDLL